MKRFLDLGELPWGTLNPDAYPAEVAQAARRSFVDGASSERATAIGFSEITSALLRAGAPTSFTRMSTRFVEEELLHAEINARLAREVGADPVAESSDAYMTFGADPEASLLDQALELAVRVSCVGEALSVPLLSLAARRATHPLVRAALLRIVKDEPAHARLRIPMLDWARDRLDTGRRDRLSAIATRELGRFADYFADRFEPEDASVRTGMRAMGFAPVVEYRDVVRMALRDRVVLPLAKRGVAVDVVAALAPPETRAA